MTMPTRNSTAAPTNSGGPVNQASRSATTKASSTGAGSSSTPGMQHSIDPRAVLLPDLLAALATALPCMNSRSLADTAVGLLQLMPNKVLKQAPEAKVLQWVEIVAGILERKPSDERWKQLQVVLAKRRL